MGCVLCYGCVVSVYLRCVMSICMFYVHSEVIKCLVIVTGSKNAVFAFLSTPSGSSSTPFGGVIMLSSTVLESPSEASYYYGSATVPVPCQEEC